GRRGGPRRDTAPSGSARGAEAAHGQRRGASSAARFGRARGKGGSSQFSVFSFQRSNRDHWGWAELCRGGDLSPTIHRSPFTPSRFDCSPPAFFLPLVRGAATLSAPWPPLLPSSD